MEMKAGVFVLLLLFASTANSLQCYDCESAERSDACMHEQCTGDYCVVTTFAPRFGNEKFSKQTTVRGCVEGSLLKKGVKNQCETMPEGEAIVSSCFCSDRDNCNSNSLLPPRKKETLVECLCDDCKDNLCRGEFCTISKDSVSGAESRGCQSSSDGLIEGRGQGSVVQPPLTGAHHNRLAKGVESLLRLKAYTCSTHRCNAKWPRRLAPARLRCPVYAGVNIRNLGQSRIKEEGGCLGQYCWNVNISVAEGMYRGYAAAGCMTMPKGAKVSPEFNTHGCLQFSSTNYKVKACFHDEGKPLSKAEIARLEREEKEGEVELSAEVEEEEEEELEAGGEKVKLEEDVQVKETEKEKPPAKSKGKHHHRHESSRDEQQRRRAKPLSKTEELEKEEEEGNTLIITLFIFVIIAILVAGAVWKFSLHKKLFRARYETVAG